MTKQKCIGLPALEIPCKAVRWSRLRGEYRCHRHRSKPTCRSPRYVRSKPQKNKKGGGGGGGGKQ